MEFLDIQHLFPLFLDNIIQVKHYDSGIHEQYKKCKKWMKNYGKITIRKNFEGGTENLEGYSSSRRGQVSEESDNTNLRKTHKQRVHETTYVTETVL